MLPERLASEAMSDAPVKEGDVLAGKYRIERVLGVGGMGVVVAATHLQLDQKVALKFLLPDAMANPDVVARFAREARADLDDLGPGEALEVRMRLVPRIRTGRHLDG